MMATENGDTSASAAPRSSAAPKLPKAVSKAVPTKKLAEISVDLAELDVEEVVSWLTSISLDKTFADGFREQQIDGFMLDQCKEDGFKKSDFPKAREMHWNKLW